MKNKVILTALFLFGFVILPAQSRAGTDDKEKLAIKKVLIESYVEGISVNRDSLAVKKGFHPDFLMHVYHKGRLIKADLGTWLARLKLDGKKNPKSIQHKFEIIDLTGNSSFVKMEIYENSKHIYTDYFGLYNFKDGWKIVNKIFYGHE